MANDDKVVMQVTVRAQEYPDFYRELRSMAANKQRANVLIRRAYFGWLLERSGVRLGVATAAQPANAGVQLVDVEAAPALGDWIDDLAGGDQPEGQADGASTA